MCPTRAAHHDWETPHPNKLFFPERNDCSTTPRNCLLVYQNRSRTSRAGGPNRQELAASHASGRSLRTRHAHHRSSSDWGNAPSLFAFPCFPLQQRLTCRHHIVDIHSLLCPPSYACDSGMSSDVVCASLRLPPLLGTASRKHVFKKPTGRLGPPEMMTLFNTSSGSSCSQFHSRASERGIGSM